MPYTKKQKAVARAVAHGWNPTGSAKGFDQSFAEKVLSYKGSEDERRKKMRKHMKVESTNG